MKTRLITLFLSLFWAMGVFAQTEDPSMWSPIYPPETTSSTTLYAVFQNEKMEKPIDGDRVAAFIDNECRAVYEFSGQPSTSIDGTPLPYELAQLRIRGNDIDAGKDIVIKLSLGGGIYTLTPNQSDILPNGKLAFAPEEASIGQPSNPIFFNIPFRIRQVTLSLKDPTTKEIILHVGEKINLKETFNIKISPSIATLPENTYWNSHSSNCYTINGDLLTATNPTKGFNEKITLSYGYPLVDVEPTYPYEAVFEPLIILPAVVPVERIELIGTSKSEVNRDEVFNLDFRILPENATNQEVEITVDTPDAFSFGNTEVVKEPNGSFFYRVPITALKKGIHVITIRTIDGGKVIQTEMQVKVPIVSAHFAQDSDIWWVGERHSLPKIIVEPTDADFPNFYEMKVSVHPTESTLPSDCKQWTRCEERMDDNGWYFIPRVISTNMVLELYLGAGAPLIQHLDFNKRHSLYEGGWHWVSVPYIYDFKTNDVKRDLIEIRGEYNMVYNDPKYGWFGDAFNMVPGEGYKLHSHPTATFQLSYSPNEISPEVRYLDEGWNWIGVPYEYDYDMTQIPQIVNSQEGDIILSKNDGMLTFTQGKWESSLNEPFALRSGEGYLYKAIVPSEIHWGVQFDVPQPPLSDYQNLAARPTRKSYWQMDKYRFASAMAVIGHMTLNDSFDADRYSIGAFVGNECRGEGRILDNGLILLSLNGETGNEITFKLLDKETEEIFDFETIIHFNQMAGSVQHPVPFTLKHEVTGIDQISGEDLNIYFMGEELMVDGGYPFKILSTDGKVVSAKNLATGVYIVVVETPNGPVTQKVVKK